MFSVLKVSLNILFFFLKINKLYKEVKKIIIISQLIQSNKITLTKMIKFSNLLNAQVFLNPILYFNIVKYLK